jgi:hypothetical protein
MPHGNNQLMQLCLQKHQAFGVLTNKFISIILHSAFGGD